MSWNPLLLCAPSSITDAFMDESPDGQADDKDYQGVSTRVKVQLTGSILYEQVRLIPQPSESSMNPWGGQTLITPSLRGDLSVAWLRTTRRSYACLVSFRGVAWPMVL